MRSAGVALFSFGQWPTAFWPVVSNKAKKAMRQAIHNWRMHLKPDKTLEDLARMLDPMIRGWINYYGRFYKSELYSVLKHMNRALVRWVRRKYKKLANQRRATHWLRKVARREQGLFVH
ncbi:MAG: group II intron maturase-specific domain-containing protein [Clostridia bacterium]|nr:group II intron maturase-specific domain-containing protein [Clostridia bacterium]